MKQLIHCAPQEKSNFLITRNTDLHVTIEEYAHCTIILQSTSSIQVNLTIELNGTHAECIIKAALLLNGEQKAHIVTQQIHNAPDTTSTVIVKSVVNDRAISTYTGAIVIHETAPRSIAHQNSYALILSSQAQAYAHPALEVLTNDVQCGHGAAVAALDSEHLFYLQSRGLGKDVAQQLIIQSFLELTQS